MEILEPESKLPTMKPLIIRCFFISFCCAFFCGCKTLKLPYKSKSEIAKEFQQSYYYDESSLTGFRKDWDFRFYSKSDARTGMKEDKVTIDSFLKFATPVYAAKRKSYDGSRENMIIFEVNDVADLKNFLSGNFTYVDTLLHDQSYSFKNFKDRQVSMFYAHNRNLKTISAPVLVDQYASVQKYLIYYHVAYNDLFTYLKQIYEWEVIRFLHGDEYVTANLSESSRFIPDPIVMLWPFSSIAYPTRSINQFEDVDQMDFLRKPDSLLLVNGQISYQTALEALIKNFREDFYSEQSSIDLQVYFQTKAFYESFIGNYKEAVESEAMYKFIDLKFKLKDSQQVTDARSFLMNKIRDQKIVAFNESHHDVRCRAFVISFLDSLRKAGFTQIAFEDLQKDPEDGDVFFNSGYYCREPLFHNMVLAAIEKGFKVISYDNSSRQRSKYYERDKFAAKTLLQKAKLNKGEKLVIFCGYGHIDKAKDKSNPSSLIDYITKYSGIEPLTVDLAYPRLYQLQDTSVDHFFVLTKGSDTGFFHNKLGSNGDISVYPPNGIPYFDYQYYVSNSLIDYKKVTVVFQRNISISDSALTTYVYESGKVPNGEIKLPVFTKFIENKNQKIDIFLPNDQHEYFLEIRTADNRIVEKSQLQIQ